MQFRSHSWKYSEAEIETKIKIEKQKPTPTVLRIRRLINALIKQQILITTISNLYSN